MPENFWYSARANEIFLDLDSYVALRRAMTVLSVAIRGKKLKVKTVWLFESSPSHYHVIVELSEGLTMLSRLAWSLWMGNDRLRVAYVIERFAAALEHTDLLVSSKPYHRPADASCTCKKKHKPKNVTDRCPAMARLLGNARSADYFARTGPQGLVKKRMRVPWGRVSVKQIHQWREVRKRAG